MTENSLEDRVAHRYRCPAAFQPGVPSSFPRSPGCAPPGAEGGCPALSWGVPRPEHRLRFPPLPHPRPGRSGDPLSWRPYLAEGRSRRRPAAAPRSLPRVLSAGRGRGAGAGPGRAGQGGRCRHLLLLAAADSGAGAVPHAAAGGRPPRSAQDRCPQPPHRARTARRRGSGPHLWAALGTAGRAGRRLRAGRWDRSTPMPRGSGGAAAGSKGRRCRVSFLRRGRAGGAAPGHRVSLPLLSSPPGGTVVAPSTALRPQGFYCSVYAIWR